MKLVRWLEPLGWVAFAVLLLAAMAKPARGDEPAFRATFTPAKTIPPTLRVEAPSKPANADDALYLWVVNPQPSDLIATHEAATWTAEAGKAYSITWVMKERGKPQQQRSGVVMAGDGKPPGPKPEAAPIPAEGLHVLIVYESAEAATMPAGQMAAIYGAEVRNYLNATCPAGPDGQTKQWRIYDQGVDLSAESKLWQDAMKRPRKSLPWIVVSNPKAGGFEGPLPATAAETLALVKKYGEVK